MTKNGIIILIIVLSTSCANPGTKSLTGGPKDETPPEVVKSIPENYSTNFSATEVEITFNEYLKPLQGIKQKLVISPVMDELPEIKLKGKSIIIKFMTELLPDRTYTLNFGDAVADLNEGNTYENFMYVFSTGEKLDSLEMSGIVLSAIDNKPLEGAVVMLYQDDQDSLPLTDLPIYLSITDKEGKYQLKNLAGGSYKVFALKDANSNFLYDQPKEEIGFLDSLVTPGVRLIEKLSAITITAQQNDTTLVADSTMLADSVQIAASVQLSDSALLADSTMLSDSNILANNILPDSLQITDSLNTLDSKPKYEYYPKNIELYTFTEKKQKQFISSSARSKANKIEVLFNQPLDSLTINLLAITKDTTDSNPVSDPVSNPNPVLNPDPDSSSNIPDQSSYLINYSASRDSIDIWLCDTSLASRDTIIFNFQYTGFDSLEQPIPFSDTVAFSFRNPPPKKDEKKKNPFKIKANFSSIKELGQAAKLTFSEPWEIIDTSKIELARIQDTTKFKIEFKLNPDTLKPFNIQTNDEKQKTNDEKQKTNDEKRITNNKTSPTIYKLKSTLLPDSTYSLNLLPGAFTTYARLTNDTTKLRFKVSTEDKYGSIVLDIKTLHQPAVLQLLKGKKNVLAERRLSQSGLVKFSLLKPGKYNFKLILDKNNNGSWDSGRYLMRIQPEEVLYYGKELDLKANWEMEETWDLEKE